MRAIIRLKSANNDINESSLKGYLESRKWKLYNIEDSKLGSKISAEYNELINTIPKEDLNDLKIYNFIVSQNAKGLFSKNTKDDYYGLRIYKRDPSKLTEKCQTIVSDLIDYFKNDIKFDTITIRTDGQIKDTMFGIVHLDEIFKEEKAKEEKETEIKTSNLLLRFGILFLSISFLYNNFNDKKIEFLNWLIQTIEKFIGPLIISTLILKFNYKIHKERVLKENNLIEWKWK